LRCQTRLGRCPHELVLRILDTHVHGIGVDDELSLAKAIPDAEVAVMGAGGVGSQYLEEAGQLLDTPVLRLGVVLALAKPYRMPIGSAG
jgi:hypothetical protein